MVYTRHVVIKTVERILTIIYNIYLFIYLITKYYYTYHKLFIGQLPSIYNKTVVIVIYIIVRTLLDQFKNFNHPDKIFGTHILEF